ncbi:MAG: aminoglycoside phosphotransferase family protein [Oscillospiraceae bacterium]|nr:aminoglycoside phosphotransferase family protein [Oscillospiraceae bacterium]
MKSLFSAEISHWQDWEKVFQSIPEFTPLVEHILKKECLPVVDIENLTPGTNAVFKVGGYVVKIFAPAESGFDQTVDLPTELFAMRRANELGVSAPKLIADGFVEDKYRFGYLITEYINGVELFKAAEIMSDDEKVAVGRKLRDITDKMNTPCEPFNGIDVINDENRRWNKYPERFKAERLAYIKKFDYGEKVFVHGDLCGDNILISPEGELYIIDFADSSLAPGIYEHALVAFLLEYLDPMLMYGYFGDYVSTDEFIEMCFDGILIHDYGGEVIMHCVGQPNEFECLEDLREKIRKKFTALRRVTPQNQDSPL